jgi:hypothetical protein
MTAFGDEPDEMRRLRLDDDTIERLLAGRIAPEDAPPGYAQLASLIRCAAAAPTPDELRDQGLHVEAARSLQVDESPDGIVSDGRSTRMRSKGYRLKVTGFVAIGTLLGTTGLAAAGVLPDTAQDVVSDALARVGITVPAGDDHPASSGEEISGLATSTDLAGVDKGAEISSLASGGISQAGRHGSGSGDAEGGPAGAPSGEGTGTADSASGGISDVGTDVAADRGDDPDADDHGADQASDGAAVSPAPPGPPAP